MRLSLFVLASVLHGSLAWPGMKETVGQVRDKAARQATSDGSEPKQLIGDLKTLKDAQLTAVGKDIKAMLLTTASAESNVIDSSIPPQMGSAACKADTCCIWKYISYAMIEKFNGTAGRCTKFARQAVRLGFHDAGAWSNTTTFGGADGSIILTDEWKRSENAGMDDIVGAMQLWYSQYKQYGVTAADLIQFGANVAVTVCPLGPRIKTYVGRPDNAKAGPTGLLPGVNDSADKLINLFRAKTIDPHGLVALVGAHSTSQQHKVNTARDGDPQDSTPGIWDVAFYGETTGSAPVRVMRFPSDVALSKDPRSAGEWKRFINDQKHWNEDYAHEYVRLSLLGVNNINNLKECTKVLPPARPKYTAPDQAVLNIWLSGQLNELSNQVDNADYLGSMGGRM